MIPFQPQMPGAVIAQALEAFETALDVGIAEMVVEWPLVAKSDPLHSSSSSVETVPINGCPSRPSIREILPRTRAGAITPVAPFGEGNARGGGRLPACSPRSLPRFGSIGTLEADL